MPKESLNNWPLSPSPFPQRARGVGIAQYADKDYVINQMLPKDNAIILRFLDRREAASRKWQKMAFYGEKRGGLRYSNKFLGEWAGPEGDGCTIPDA